MPESEKAAEKLLTKLRRLPENRVCPNCLKEDPAGFGAICVPFKTFICSDCKSAHQSFSQRVKSVSQSVWTMEEVKALDEKNGGGNRLATELYMTAMSENERPAPGALEAIKRFVQKVYIDEVWKGTSRKSTSMSSTSPSSGYREKKHKDKDKRRDRVGSAMSSEMSRPGESGSSLTSTPKHRSSRKRREAQNGWGVADFAMYKGDAPQEAWAGGDFGQAAAGDRWGTSSGQPLDGFYGYDGPAQPATSSMQPLDGFYGYDGRFQGLQPPKGLDQLQQPYAAAGYNGGPEQAGTWSQQPTPFVGAGPAAPFAAAAGGVPLRPPAAGVQSPMRNLAARSAELPWGAAARQAPTLSPAVSHTSSARTAGKETMTLHPTNPWADVLGSIITIRPTNPWADVVAPIFASGDPGSTSTQNLVAVGIRPQAASCGSQQKGRAQQQNQLVY